FITACQYVLGNGNDLYCQEQHQQVAEAGCQHNAGQDEKYQRKIIRYVLAYLFKFTAGQQEIQQGGAQCYCIKEDAEPAYFYHAIQGTAASLQGSGFCQVSHKCHQHRCYSKIFNVLLIAYE